MDSQDIEARFIRELNSPKPTEGLWLLAHALRDEGLPQLELYLLFAKNFVTTPVDDLRYDALADTMDAIHGGPRASGGGLYPSPLTDAIIHAGRKERVIA